MLHICYAGEGAWTVANTIYTISLTVILFDLIVERRERLHHSLQGLDFSCITVLGLSSIISKFKCLE